MSSIPQNKNELIQAISVSYEKLTLDYERVPNALTRSLGVEGNVKGTIISVCDTLAYLIGWGKLVLKWYDFSVKGKDIDFPETGYQWNQLGALAQAFQLEYKDWTFEKLKKEYQRVIQVILTLLHKLDEHILYGEAWYKQWTLGRMIQFNTSSPMKNVRTKIRRFINNNTNK